MREKGFLLATAGVNSDRLIPNHRRLLKRLDARLSQFIVWLLRWGRFIIVIGLVGLIAYLFLKSRG